MLWLIWIAMMLLVPTFAGVQVWLQVHRTPADVLPTTSRAESAELSGRQPREAAPF